MRKALRACYKITFEAFCFCHFLILNGQLLYFLFSFVSLCVEKENSLRLQISYFQLWISSDNMIFKLYFCKISCSFLTLQGRHRQKKNSRKIGVIFLFQRGWCAISFIICCVLMQIAWLFESYHAIICGQLHGDLTQMTSLFDVILCLILWE